LRSLRPSEDCPRKDGRHAGKNSPRNSMRSHGADSGRRIRRQFRLASGRRQRHPAAQSIRSDAPAISESVPMILGNVHDETSVAGHGFITWIQQRQCSRLRARVLGPTRRKRLSQSFARSSGLHGRANRYSRGNSIPRLARSALEAERAQRTEEPAPHMVYQMNFQGANGKAMHTIDILHVRQHRQGRSPVGSAPGHLAEANALAATMSQCSLPTAQPAIRTTKSTHWPLTI